MTRGAAIRPNGKDSVSVQTTGKMARLLKGELTLDDMDDDELFRMQFKNKNGSFTGAKPAAVPRDLAMRMQREMMNRSMDTLRMGVMQAVENLVRLANSADDEGVQLRANALILDRVFGKTPDKVEISGDSPWQVILQSIIVPQNGEAKPARQQTVAGHVVKDE